MDYIVYHSKDLDGKASGAILSEAFKSAKLIGYDYGEELLLTENISDKSLVMADVTVPMERLFRLAYDLKGMVLIDHHVSAFNDILKYAEENNLEVINSEFNGLITELRFPEFNFTYYYSAVLSACEICFRLYPIGTSVTEAKVRLLGQYDTWRNNGKELVKDFNWEEQVLPFQMGSRVHNTVKQVLDFLFKDNINDTITAGEGIIKYLDIANGNNMVANSFLFEMNGMRILACNGAGFSSQSFKDFYLEEIHDAMMPFYYCGVTRTWKFSLFTTKDDTDILSLAKNFGGGGHQKACGFQLAQEEFHIKDGVLFLGPIVTIDIASLPEGFDFSDTEKIRKMLSETPMTFVNSVKKEVVELKKEDNDNNISVSDAPVIPQPPKKKVAAKKKPTTKKK